MGRTLVLCAVLAGAGLQPPIAVAQTEPLRMQVVTAQDGTSPFGGALIYLITGGGGTTLALVDEGTGGVVLVDTKRAGWGKPLRDALRAVTEMPVTMIINTHAHSDHTGGNIDFATATEIVAHGNTKAHMTGMDAFRGANEKFLPNKTFEGRLSLSHGSTRIDLYYFGAAHTDGDAIVVFPEKRLAYVGDLFRSRAAPFIDTTHGGSGVAFPDTLAKVVDIKGVDRVITGHAGADTAAGRQPEILRWTDLQEYADFTREFLSAVRKAFDARKTVDEAVVTLNLPEKYKPYDMERAKADVQAIYDELRRP